MRNMALRQTYQFKMKKYIFLVFVYILEYLKKKLCCLNFSPTYPRATERVWASRWRDPHRGIFGSFWNIDFKKLKGWWKFREIPSLPVWHFHFILCHKKNFFAIITKFFLQKSGFPSAGIPDQKSFGLSDVFVSFQWTGWSFYAENM